MQKRVIKTNLATDVATSAQSTISLAKKMASDGYSSIEEAKGIFNKAIRYADSVVTDLEKYRTQAKEMGFADVVQKIEKIQNDAKQLSKEINAPLSKLKSL
jgi:maltooligosyltrehalose synthase